MTGAEHYAAGEHYLAQAVDGPTVDVMLDVAVAQAHFTAAHAAATAGAWVVGVNSVQTAAEWRGMIVPAKQQTAGEWA